MVTITYAPPHEHAPWREYRAVHGRQRNRLLTHTYDRSALFRWQKNPNRVKLNTRALAPQQLEDAIEQCYCYWLRPMSRTSVRQHGTLSYHGPRDRDQALQCLVVTCMTEE